VESQVGYERFFGPDDIFFSTTDPKGVIQRSNRTFDTPPPPPPPARRGGGFYFSASRSLYPHQPRAWLCHTHLLRTAQILKPRCRVCAVRTHAFYALRQPAPVGINTYPIFPKKQPPPFKPPKAGRVFFFRAFPLFI